MICPRIVGQIHSAAAPARRTLNETTLTLFAASLALGVLTQDAHAWVAAFSEGTTASAPMGAEGLVAFVSIITAAISAVWLYLTQLAR